MKWKDLLIWSPALLFLVWWKITTYVHDTLNCHVGKTSLPCLWHDTDIQGWIGSGMFLGMLFFIVSALVAAVVQFEVWMRRLEKKLKAGPPVR